MLDTGKLDRITTWPALIDYLRDELEWPIGDYSYDDLTFEWNPKEFGLSTEGISGRIEIKQLRPLEAEDWGIFFLSLPHKKLPVTVLRRILGSLAPKKRASANPADRVVWNKHDLLFIAAHGAGDERGLAFAHFHENRANGDLPTLNVLGWDRLNTVRRLSATHHVLKHMLHWRDPGETADAWRARWSEAFREKPGQAIATSKAMASELAHLAGEIRRRANELLAEESDDGPLRTLHNAFRQALIHDLKFDDFADMYAQTVAYGLLSARISRESGALVADNAADLAPPTNPFLKELLQTFLSVGGRKGGMDFDELGVNDVVEMLRRADMEAVLRDFDDRNPNEDPVIHFYELFLKEYDARKRMQRGVFYTPRPVVKFIVRSVDEVLRTEFGLEDGLASTATWADVIAARPEIELPKNVNGGDSFVRVLDPATGTGTFLVETIGLIHERMTEKWRGAGKRDIEIEALWNDYVPKHLLPRLYGFELMMAPYAIAHMKLGLKLAETGYHFRSDERARIFLTNSLEPAQDFDMQLAFMSEALAHEAQSANRAKEVRITIVMGNPPYSLMSSNLGPQHRRIVDAYRYIGGEKIKERGALQFEKNLQDDYVKFFRVCEEFCARVPLAILSLITNHSYLQSPSLRGMRYSLFGTFLQGRFLDLHGNAKTGERTPTGDKDENVFEIQQGVAVCCLVRGGSPELEILRGDLWGSQPNKYAKLSHSTMAVSATERNHPAAPTYAVEPSDNEVRSSFRARPSLSEIFPHYSTGVATARDAMAVQFDEGAIAEVMKDFIQLDAEALRHKYDLGSDTNDWKVQLAVADVKANKNSNRLIAEYYYRPFDTRYTLYTGKPRGFLCNPRLPVMRNLSNDGVGLCTVKAIEGGGGYRHIIATQRITDHRSISLKEVSYVIPLWIRPEGTESRTIPNVSSAVAGRIGDLTCLSWDDCVDVPRQAQLAGIVSPKPEQTTMFGICRERGDLVHSFAPRDIFDWVYAVLHAPAYRTLYADYLKSDFARIPLPGSRDVFRALVPLGTKLVALHLLDAVGAPELRDPQDVRFAGHGDARVELAPSYSPDTRRVAISSRRWFESVPGHAWDFRIGSYQPAQKWLKDRGRKGGKKPQLGRILKAEDQLHYRRMVVAIDKTIDVMAEIDRTIDQHGGWPHAFRGMTE